MTATSVTPSDKPLATNPSTSAKDKLDSHIERRLCELGNLVSGQFPMTQREVIRKGKSVGIYFCLHGPRSVKLTAIYDSPKNQVIFYGSDGLRKESLDIQPTQQLGAA